MAAANDRDTLPSPIAKALSDGSLVPSRRCIALLRKASELSARKIDRRFSVSCSGIFFSLFQDDDPESEDATRSLDKDAIAVERMKAEFKRQVGPAQLDQLLRGYYEQTRSPRLPGSVTATDSLLRVFNGLALTEAASVAFDSFPLPANMLVSAVLSEPETHLQHRLSKLDVDVETLRELLSYTYEKETTRTSAAPRQAPPNDLEPEESAPGEAAKLGAWGAGARIERDPQDEKAILKTPEYASAIATVMRAADGEFSFGLFGPWGVGKTKLVDTLKPLLEDPIAYRETTKALPRLNARPDACYVVTSFSAWKYPRPPESWVHFYEHLADRCLKANLLTKAERLLRIGILRHGYGPVWFAVALLVVASFAAPFVFAALALAALIASAAWLAQASRIFTKSREVFQSFAQRYASLSRHGDKLGMQAVIGSDLRTLLIGWMPKGKRTNGETWTYDFTTKRPFGAWGALLSLTLIAGAFFDFRPHQTINLLSPAIEGLCGTLEQAGARRCLAWTHSLSAEAPNGAEALLTLISFAAAALLVLFTIKTVLLPVRSPDRMLVVIDDLDRCTPEVALEFAESIKLLLEDPAIQERVQMAMLIDEEVLTLAIEKKFEGLIEMRRRDADKRRAGRAASDVVREHIEKLFACFLRLPPIANEDIAKLTDHFMEGAAGEPANNAGTSAMAPDPAGARRAEGGRTDPAPNRGQDGATAPIADDPSPIPTTPDPSATPKAAPALFDRAERDALERLLPQAMRKGGRRPSPRGVRIFLFKYQLLRALMGLAAPSSALGSDQAIEALAEACFAADPALTSPNRADLAFVVAQIA